MAESLDTPPPLVRGDTERVVVKVVGMDCPSCAAGLAKSVLAADGVVEAEVNFTAATLTVTFDPLRVDLEQIVQRVRLAGYDVDLADLSRLVGTGGRGGAGRAGLLPWLHRHRRAAATAASLGLLVCGALAEWLNLSGRAGLLHVGLYLAATAAGGFYVARAAMLSLATRRIDMNVLMTIAVVGALAIGYWSEAATVAFLFALSLVLEERAMDRVRHAIRSLLKLKPDRVRLLEQDGGERLVPPEEVAVGRSFRVRPSERIGLDGVVVAGAGSVDQSAVTGESMPVARSPGEEVLAGTINQDSTLTIRATRPAGQSTISRIIHLVEQAQAARAPAQRFVDRFARVYTPLVVAAAVLVATVPPALLGRPFLEPPDAGPGQHGWLYRALVLLVIACPCALVISTPVAVVSALTAAARHGVLIKGGIHLETLGRVHCIVFDKTGTLTVGRPGVTDVICAGGLSPAQLLAIAAALESQSEHHLARAILHHAHQRNITWSQPTEMRVQPGRGVIGRLDQGECWLGNQRLADEMGADLAPVAGQVARLEAEGKTVVLVGRGRGLRGRRDSDPRPEGPAEGPELLGLIGLADEVRPSAGPALDRLRQAVPPAGPGRGGAAIEGQAHRARLVMLTGDNRATAAAIAGRLGMDAFLAELLPDEKVEHVRRLAADCTGSVAMVGDGVNDAPALAAADVGIAMGTAGTDAALQTADVALIGDDLAGVPLAVKLGRWTARLIAQNVSFSIAVKAVFLGLGLAGLANLWMAVFADMGASLLVIANGLRLLRVRRE